MAAGAGLGADQDQLLVPERPGAQPQMPAGVLDVHPELLLGRRVVADCLQPRRGTPAPAGRVDDEIGGEDLLPVAARARQHAGTGDPVPGRRGDQAGYLALVLDRDVGQGPDPVADMGFQARPARAGTTARRVRRPGTAGGPRRRTGTPAEHAAPGHRPPPGRRAARGTARRGSAPRAAAARGRPALGNPLAVQPGLRQRVPFDDRHPPVRISQHTGREQPAHTGTQNRRVITNLLHFVPPPVSRPKLRPPPRASPRQRPGRASHRLSAG